MNFLINTIVFGLVIGVSILVVRSHIQGRKKYNLVAANCESPIPQKIGGCNTPSTNPMPKLEINQSINQAGYEPFDYANPENAWLYTSANPNSPLNH